MSRGGLCKQLCLCKHCNEVQKHGLVTRTLSSGPTVNNPLSSLQAANCLQLMTALTSPATTLRSNTYWWEPVMLFTDAVKSASHDLTSAVSSRSNRSGLPWRPVNDADTSFFSSCGTKEKARLSPKDKIWVIRGYCHHYKTKNAATNERLPHLQRLGISASKVPRHAAEALVHVAVGVPVARCGR